MSAASEEVAPETILGVTLSTEGPRGYRVGMTPALRLLVGIGVVAAPALVALVAFLPAVLEWLSGGTIS